MKYQNPFFSGENKKSINVSSAELATRVVKVKQHLSDFIRSFLQIQFSSVECMWASFVGYLFIN